MTRARMWLRACVLAQIALGVVEADAAAVEADAPAFAADAPAVVADAPADVRLDAAADVRPSCAPV